MLARIADTPATPLEGEEGDDLWNLVLEAGRLDEVVELAVRSLEPAGLAKYAFALAQLFNALYHKYPVAERRAAGVAVLARGGDQLLQASADEGARADGRQRPRADVANADAANI